MIDEELLQKSIENYLKWLEDKNWPDLTREQIELINDDTKRIEYRKKYRECINVLIVPLLHNMNNKNNFKFSNPNNALTCNNMIKDIYGYYKRRGFNKEDIIRIASEMHSDKRY